MDNFNMYHCRLPVHKYYQTDNYVLSHWDDKPCEHNFDGDQTVQTPKFFLLQILIVCQEYAEKLRAEFEQEKKRAVNVATR